MLLSCSVRIFISGTNIGLINVALGLPKRPEKRVSQKDVNLFFNLLTTAVNKSKNQFTVLCCRWLRHDRSDWRNRLGYRLTTVCLGSHGA